MKVFSLRRLAISVVLALALAGIWYSFSIGEDPPPPRITDSAVRTVYPASGDRVARQSTVFFELQPQYDGTFVAINNRPIPEDQVDEIGGLNRFSFTAGEGKEIEEFSPGRNCAEITFWIRGQSRASGRGYQWCYSLH